MNKTLSIGLAGFSFTIEEHAYIKLSDYLAALRNSLDSTEADEVMHDIEIRMVEIFKDALGKREVINDTDVERVIAQIGTPEIIEEQEEAYFSEKSSSKKHHNQSGTYATGKQLFRDPEQAKIAGVCAGLAHYFGMDVTWMRVIWVLIFIAGLFTAAISSTLIGIIYVIFWAVLPVASTASDFLKMKGRPVNFDTLKEESGKIVQFANESTQKVGQMYNESKPVINAAGSGLWNVLRIILGAFFAILSFLFIVGTFVVFGVVGTSDFPGVTEMDFYFDDGGSLKTVLMAMISIGSLIPALIFGLLSIKLIAPKTKLRNIGWVLLGLFVALIGLSSYFGVSMAKKDMFYRGHNEDTENVSIETPSDTLYLDVKKVTIPQNFIGYDDNIYSDKKNVYEEDYIWVDVVKKDGLKTPYITIKKEGKGYNHPINVNVPLEISGNKILFPNYIKYPYQDRFRDYEVNYELVIPSNMTLIKLNEDKINLDGEGYDDEYNENGIKIEKNKVTINGSTIEYNSDEEDSVIINGKKYPKAVAEKITDSLDLDLKDLKDVDINIKNGKKEITIKTK